MSCNDIGRVEIACWLGGLYHWVLLVHLLQYRCNNLEVLQYRWLMVVVAKDSGVVVMMLMWCCDAMLVPWC
jgi:hypothetical protein